MSRFYDATVTDNMSIEALAFDCVRYAERNSSISPFKLNHFECIAFTYKRWRWRRSTLHSSILFSICFLLSFISVAFIRNFDMNKIEAKIRFFFFFFFFPIESRRNRLVLCVHTKVRSSMCRWAVASRSQFHLTHPYHCAPPHCSATLVLHASGTGNMQSRIASSVFIRHGVWRSRCCSQHTNTHRGGSP